MEAVSALSTARGGRHQQYRDHRAYQLQLCDRRGEVFFHSADESDLDDLDEAPAEVRAAVEAAGIVDAEFDDGITMRIIRALGGLPRTLDELREISLVIAPYDSRPELFRRPTPTLAPQPYPFR